MGGNFAYRSVFEKGFEILCFDPEAAALAEDVALAGTLGVLVEGEDTTDFADAAARFIAARPLALTAEVRELALLGVLEIGSGAARDEREEQLCELGKRCSGQNFWRHFCKSDEMRVKRVSFVRDSHRTVFERLGLFHTWVLSTLVQN